MGSTKQSRDTSKTLAGLKPFELYPYAVRFVAPYRKVEFRRYGALGHAKTAASYTTDAVIYEFNFDTDTWEEMT